MTMSTMRRGLLAAAAACMLSATGPAFAQAGYPNKPVRLVVGFAPGGAADVFTRIIATQLGKQMGQQVIVENRPGADGILSVQAVTGSPADGYTILMGTNTALVAVPSLRPNPPYDPFKALVPISSAGQFSMFLVVPTNFPAKSVKELLDLTAANPDKYNSGSSNSASELAMLQLLAGRKVTNARYKGDVPALTDMGSEQIHMMFTTGTSAPTFVKSGKVRALVTLQPTRSPLMPDVPTAAEAGIAGNLTITPWAGFFAPAGTPSDIVQRLSTEMQKALQTPEVREQLAQQGFAGQGMSPEDFKAYFRLQYDSFTKIVKDNNIKFE
jgi:tripartite-type tricarboxylate transporter receptor subunit TctC